MNADQLIALWDARDERYRLRTAFGRPSPLSEAEQNVVIACRSEEVKAIEDEGERLDASMQLAAWSLYARWSPVLK